jgi:hypothetical protein
MSIIPKDVIYRFMDITFNVTKIEKNIYNAPNDFLSTDAYTFSNNEHWCVGLSHSNRTVVLPYAIIRKVSKYFSLGHKETVKYLMEYFHTKYDFPPDYDSDYLPF